MPSEDNEYLSLRIDPELKKALRKAADDEGRSVGNLVKYLIRQYCDSKRYGAQEARKTRKKK